MTVLTIEMTLYAPWVHSLKEKRMELKSLMQRLRGKFQLSVAEIAEQDTHQIMVIGLAAIVSGAAMADSVYESVLRFVESGTEAQVTGIVRELR